MKLNWRFIARRFAEMLLTMWVIATILFFMFRLMPGNPLAAYIDPNFTKEQQAILFEQFGLNKPLWHQYLIYIVNLFRGELGQSFFYRESVMTVVGRVLPNTLYLMVSSFILAYVFGIFGGIFLAYKRGSKTETLGIIATLLTRAAPQFWVGMIFLAIFSFQMNIFPSGGVSPAGSSYTSEWAKLITPAFWRHLSLPAITLSIYLCGLPLLLMRSNMLDVMSESFVNVARMRGLSELRVMLKYAARNATLPVITTMAVGLGYAIGGNVVLETVFSWPGLGRLLVRAVSMSDYPLSQGAFLLIAGIMVFMNFVADILYSILDPRVSLDGKG